HHGTYEELQKDIFSLSQMGGGFYPVPQGFSMGHGGNMGAVGMRQDAMVQRTKICRSKLPANDAMRGFNAPRTLHFSPPRSYFTLLRRFRNKLHSSGRVSRVKLYYIIIGFFGALGTISYELQCIRERGEGEREERKRMSAEDEWYNKSLSALRMNSGHHANLAAAPMLQYQT
ncbi:hypothetical protein EVAR_69382_1, partial [Eumeta japonica]